MGLLTSFRIEEEAPLGEFDAIVIGAGPGGSSAAYHLAAAGKRVLVIEKKLFPRAKTCGDGLTPRAVRVLQQMGLSSTLASYQQVTGLRVLGANRTLEMQWPKVEGYPQLGLVRTRRDFDSDMAAHAQSVGATYMFGTEAESPIWQDGVMTGVHWVRKVKAEGGGVVKEDEGEVFAPFTIIADGASSSFGRAVGIRKESSYPMGLAIRTYYECDRDDDEFFESWLDLRKGDELLPGYGWIFPLGNRTVNIGVGLLTTFGSWRNVNLNHLQSAYIDMLPKSYGITHDGQLEPYKSGRLPMGSSMVKPYGPGYVVIGDAAGTVNPFNGEGIAYALETGHIAGSVVASALDSGAGAELVAYHQAIHDIYGAYFRAGRRFTRVIGNPRTFRALCQVGMRSQTMMEFVFQVLANLYSQRGGKVSDRIIRAMVKLAEQDLADLKPPQIPVPTVKPRPKDQAGAL